MNITFDKAKLDKGEDGIWLCLRIIKESLFDSRKFVYQMPDKMFDADIKRHYEKRSLSANAYLWVLCEKIAEAIRSEKKAVYREIIGRVGVFTHLYAHVNESQRVAKCWENNGDGWIAEFIETRGDYVTIRAYVGSSQYNKVEMTRVIDEAISEAKELGIETATPDEIASMINLWGDKA